ARRLYLRVPHPRFVRVGSYALAPNTLFSSILFFSSLRPLRLSVKLSAFSFSYRSFPPKNKCATATSTTAPTVAAASESKNVFSCTIPSFVKIHPPITDPISPTKISPMHPNPRPRPNFPASHPAINPTIIHAKSPWGAWFHTLRRFLSTSFCCIINAIAPSSNICPPSVESIVILNPRFWRVKDLNPCIQPSRIQFSIFQFLFSSLPPSAPAASCNESSPTPAPHPGSVFPPPRAPETLSPAHPAPRGHSHH